MNSEEIIFQQYRLYTEQKDRFIDRSFYTNRFYLVLTLVIILIMFLTKESTFVFGLSSTLIFGAAGMLVSSLWWMNVDAYEFLIKVKLSKVIEEIEKQLPVQPFTLEFAAIQDIKKKKKEFLFSDIQKGLATLSILLFGVLFLNELLSLILG